MTIGKVTGTVCAVALCTMAYVSVQERRDNVEWREAAPEREEREQELLRSLLESWQREMIRTIGEESERDDAEREAESLRNQKVRLLERVASHRPLVTTCSYIPQHILTDIHEIPRRFNDDREVMQAYAILTVEPSENLPQREAKFDSMLEAMVATTGTTERFPELPAFAPEFVVRCYE